MLEEDSAGQREWQYGTEKRNIVYVIVYFSYEENQSDGVKVEVIFIPTIEQDKESKRTVLLKYKREKVKRCLLIKDKSFPKAQEKGNRRERERSGASWTEVKVQGQA